MRRFLSHITWASLLVIPYAFSAPATKPTCAVLAFDARGGVTKDEASTLTQRFVTELAKVGTYRLMSQDKMAEILKAQDFSRSDNCSASECAIEAGKLLAIQYIVFGSVGKVGKTYTVNVSLANVETGESEKSASHDIKGEIDDVLVTGMLAAARRLLGLPVADSSGVQSASGDTQRNEKPTPSVVMPATRDLVLDLGGGVKMDFVWIEPLKRWFGKHEVTNIQLRRFLQSHNSGTYNGPAMMDAKTYKLFSKGAIGFDHYALDDDSQPAINIAVGDISKFVASVNQAALRSGLIKTNDEIRLATAAEWLGVACLGGDATKTTIEGYLSALEQDMAIGWATSVLAQDNRGLPWPPVKGNFADESMKKALGAFYASRTFVPGYEDGYVVSCPVERSGGNALGIFGMCGNVAEITVDGDRLCPLGGSWRRNDIELRYDNLYTQDDVGLRLVVAPSPTAQLVKTSDPRLVSGDNEWRVPEMGMMFVWIPCLHSWVGRYEVTNREFRHFRPEHRSAHGMDGDDYPVNTVSFMDAEGFVKWLNERERQSGRLPEGVVYRLLTENEWRLLMQCGDDRVYPWGNGWPPTYGNIADESFNAIENNARKAGGQETWAYLKGYKDGYAYTCPVEKSGMNEWGINGLVGNVVEWLSANRLAGSSYGHCLSKSDTVKDQFIGTLPLGTRSGRIGFRVAIGVPTPSP